MKNKPNLTKNIRKYSISKGLQNVHPGIRFTLHERSLPAVRVAGKNAKQTQFDKQINVSMVLTKDYENVQPCECRK
jgi:hypothetical protein